MALVAKEFKSIGDSSPCRGCDNESREKIGCARGCAAIKEFQMAVNRKILPALAQWDYHSICSAKHFWNP